jgi:hypothetical protein
VLFYYYDVHVTDSGAGTAQSYSDDAVIDDVILLPSLLMDVRFKCLKPMNHCTCWVNLYTSYIALMGPLRDWFTRCIQ